jgi:hypothetical protein
LLETDTELSSGWGLKHASSGSGLGLESGTVILRVPTMPVWNVGALHDEWESSNLDTQRTAVWQRVLAQLCTTAVTRDHVAEFILLVRLLEESRGRYVDDTGSDATNSPWQTWVESLPQTLTTGFLCFIVDQLSAQRGHFSFCDRHCALYFYEKQKGKDAPLHAVHDDCLRKDPSDPRKDSQRI